MGDKTSELAEVNVCRSCLVNRHEHGCQDRRDLHARNGSLVTIVSTERRFGLNVARCDTAHVASTARALPFKPANINADSFADPVQWTYFRLAGRRPPARIDPV